jgi:hypothetical protein
MVVLVAALGRQAILEDLEVSVARVLVSPRGTGPHMDRAMVMVQLALEAASQVLGCATSGSSRGILLESALSVCMR